MFINNKQLWKHKFDWNACPGYLSRYIVHLVDGTMNRQEQWQEYKYVCWRVEHRSHNCTLQDTTIMMLCHKYNTLQVYWVLIGIVYMSTCQKCGIHIQIVMHTYVYTIFGCVFIVPTYFSWHAWLHISLTDVWHMFFWHFLFSCWHAHLDSAHQCPAWIALIRVKNG